MTKRTKLCSIGLLLLVLLSLAGLSYYFQQQQGQGQQHVTQIKQITLVQETHISGTLNPNKSLLIIAPYDGYVKKLYVQQGQAVAADQPLVSVVPFLQSKQQANPMLAPFAGRVVLLQKQEGEHVKKSDDKDFIMRIDDLSQLFLSTEIPEVDVTQLQVGQAVKIKALAVPEHEYHGTIQNLALSGYNKQSNNFMGTQHYVYIAKIKIEDADQRLKPGMSALGNIIVKKIPQALVLPHEYIQRGAQGYFVHLQNGQKRPVKLGIQTRQWVQIRKGLQLGEHVRAVDFMATQE